MRFDEPIWTSAEMGASCGAITARPWYADGLQVDSREILPGDLFVALQGEAADGHDFVADAFERGAVAAMVSGEAKNVAKDDARLVQVADTSEALGLMASHARGRAPATVIGVTGSAGKTSVVQALRQALDRGAAAHASIKSYNNYVGVPLSVARMPRQSRYGIFEIGMSGAGEITRGAATVCPDIAVVTTVGAAHVAHFENEAAIAEEKAKLIAALPKGGMAIIGIDHAHGDLLVAEAGHAGVRPITVSVLEDADVRPVRMTEHHNCTCLTANIFGTLVTYKIAQPGREWVLNSLLVLAAVKAAGADLGQAALALAALEAEPGRGRVHELNLGAGSAILFDDSYNANPLSLKAALRRLSLAPVATGSQRVAVLADIEELGQKSEEIHLSLISDLKRFNVDRIIAFGEKMAAIGRVAGIATEHWKNPLDSAADMLKSLRPGDVVMVKGANSAALHQLVQGMLKLSREENDFPAGRWRATS